MFTFNSSTNGVFIQHVIISDVAYVIQKMKNRFVVYCFKTKRVLFKCKSQAHAHVKLDKRKAS